MTTYSGKSCSFGLPRVAFVNCRLYVFSCFPFGFEGRMWELIVSVPGHCLSFYFSNIWYSTERKANHFFTQRGMGTNEVLEFNVCEVIR